MRTRTIRIAKDVEFPLDIAGQCLAVFGIRGSGKTNTAGAFVEELLEHGYPTVIIDPTDAWWGLRVGADGDPRKGYPVVIFGGSHGDIPLEESSGKVIAEFVVKEKVPIVLSIRHLRKGAQRRFVREFCEELYQLKGEPQYRTPLAVVIDEAPLFAPQKVIGDIAFVVSAVEDLIARGRTSGFGVVLISQRSATLNADVRTQADTMICHRLTAKLDRKAIVEWFEENASTEDLKTILQSLAKLQDGEGWVWAPKLDIMKRAQMRRRRTFDSSATPKLGKRIRPPKKLADVDLDKLKGQMAAVIERAKGDDPKALRSRIAELEREVKAKSTSIGAPSKAAVAKPPKVVKVEKPVLSAKHEKLLNRAAGKVADYAAAATTSAKGAADLTKAITDLIVQVAKTTAVVPPSMPVAPAAVARRQPLADVQKVAKGVKGLAAPSSPQRSESGANGTGEVGTGGLRRILVALAQCPQGMSERRLALRAGIARKGGTFRTYRAQLKKNGWIAGDKNHVAITSEGLAALGHYDPLPEGSELLRYWKNELGGGMATMLDVLARQYPAFVSTEDVATASNMESGGGTFRTYRAKLTGLELIEHGPNKTLRASAELFE
jgi:uncharacterized protein